MRRKLGRVFAVISNNFSTLLGSLTTMRFSGIPTPAALARRLGITPEQLKELVEGVEDLYQEKKFRKKRGGVGLRVVYIAQGPILRNVQRRLALCVQDSWTQPLACVHGFRKGFSALSNASAHVGREAVAVADILDFFRNITADQVLAAFRFLGANEAIAPLLTRLSTYGGFLPPGTRCSPIISNIVLRDLDTELMAGAATYTRYADDLTFSGPRGSVPTEDSLAKTLAGHGFTLRPGSYRVRVAPQRQWVTGLVVNTGPRLPLAARRRLRQEVHYIVTRGLSAHAAEVQQDEKKAIFRVLGSVLNLRSVEPVLGKVLQDKLEAVGHSPSMLFEKDDE